MSPKDAAEHAAAPSPLADPDAPTLAMMSVKIVFCCALTCGLALVALSGCTASAPTRNTVTAQNGSSEPSVALVVRLAGGGALSPAQLRNIHQAMQPEVKAGGYRIAPNTSSADFFLTVRFTPDALEPDTGHIAVLGVDPNPMNRRGAGFRADASDEVREHRQRMREIERWVESQHRNPS